MRSPHILSPPRCSLKTSICGSCDFKVFSGIVENPLLQKVSALFIFSCYTGLSHLDVMQLKKGNVETGTERLKWLEKNKDKTNIQIDLAIIIQSNNLKEISF
jgi:hypothetical protein